MEKEVVFSQIKAVYVKDFQTFGKMDPFLVFTIGKCEERTQTLEGGGKQPAWKQNVTLTYLDELEIRIKSWEEDVTSNEYMGDGKIDVKTLKANGTMDIKIQDKGELIGTVTAKYSVKNLPLTPLLIIKNIKCDFYKEAKFLLSTKPYFQVAVEDRKMVTKPKEEGNARSLIWEESLRMKIKDNQKILFEVMDEKDNGAKLFSYEARTSEFKTYTGTKKFNVNDSQFEPLGTVEFSYETMNYVQKEESQKTEEKNKKAESEMTSITVKKITGNLVEDGNDIYFKMVVGPNLTLTKEVENAKKDFVYEEAHSFYAEAKESKMTIVMYDKDLVHDDLLGVGYLSFKNLQTGESTVEIKTDKGESAGKIKLNLQVKKVTAKTFKVTDIHVELKESGDIIGSSQPYVNARIGGWAARTETGQGKKFAFKKDLDLKFSTEDKATFQIWEEDIQNHDLLFVVDVPIKEIKENKGEMEYPLKAKDSEEEGGKLSFTYEIENNTKPEKEKEKKKITEKSSNSQKEEENKPKEEEKKRQSKHDQSEDKENQNQSRGQQLKLPPIYEEPHNYGDRIFQKQSSSTLQRSILVYSIPKADRFANGPKYNGEPTFHTDSSFNRNGSKGTGFGFGNKKQFPDWMERNMKENPAPGSYFDRQTETADFKPKGPTFGISHKYYEKVTIPKEKKMLPTNKTRLKPIHG